MPRPRKVKRNEMVIACYRQGLSVRAVAEALGLSRSTVYFILKRDAPEILRREDWRGFRGKGRVRMTA